MIKTSMPTIEQRLNILRENLRLAGREASFSEDRGFGGMDPDPYRRTFAEQFEAEPRLKKLLPLLWQSFTADYRKFFASSDGSCELDFLFADASLTPKRALAEHWIDGSDAFEPNLQIHAWDASSYILRQNPRVNPRGPFFYALFGTRQALLVDTGAPLLNGNYWPYLVHSNVTGLVSRYCAANGFAPLEILVVHTREDADHCAGDADFTGKPGIRIVDPASGPMDLGGRVVMVTEFGGRCFYDNRTQWLLTGDLLGDGSVAADVKRMVDFLDVHPVDAILGGRTLEAPRESLLHLLGTRQDGKRNS